MWPRFGQQREEGPSQGWGQLKPTCHSRRSSWGHFKASKWSQIKGSGPYFVMITDPLSVDEEHALAEQGEGCAAVHLPFDHLGPVDVALDDA